MIVFGAILITGICGIFSNKRKKEISISVRGTGTVDENGKVTDYKLQGIDIVENENTKES
jgi:hypothetical protein